MNLLTAKHKKAALLLAEDTKTDKQIAAELKIGESTVAKWKRRPEFAALVEENVELLNSQALQHGIARREYRVSVMKEAHQRLLRIIEERASDPTMKGVRGGDTGLILRSQKSVGWGERAEIVTEYSVDTKLLSEIRAIHERVAKELGQEVTRSEVNGNLNITVETLDDILNGQKEA